MFGKKLSLAEAQALMVKKQLAARAISDPRILQAMGEIPRHVFVAEELWGQAYKDSPLPIGYDQTISQPYMVAFMTQALQLSADGQAVVLEIGTGSGYQAAILSRLAAWVYSIERIEPLAEQARRCLQELEINNVEIKVGDGGYGWPERAPYDGIIVTAAAPEVPAPLLTQLKEGAVLVVPTGPRRQQQELLRLHWRNDRIVEEKLAPVAFVPLIGEHGWEEDS
ncbi:MAG: protein-L-isoaspartate(D-aspartate) O-methyltransferase [Chloroflexi bacterium]|nr:protein-L-isoaspartate(D-aspartate) O-methyltransferase [Chloroflexota bacterium]